MTKETTQRALAKAQRLSPETESVMTDSQGTWYGVRYEADCDLPIPTTDMFRLSKRDA